VTALLDSNGNFVTIYYYNIFGIKDPQSRTCIEPQPAQPGSVQYKNPSTGTTAFVNPKYP
jgi:hypothetical protein